MMDFQKIRKVHVIYKTHLDIGFTDTAENVLKKYMKEYIPRSVAIANQLNKGGTKKFIWTVGAFLIDYCLKNGDENERKRLEEAVKRGDICWHGLPFTTHTELMDADLLRYGIEIGKRLDNRFGRQTVATKMTDVPGHTIAVVDELARSGLCYLHIGVNASSRVPDVPNTFVWRHGEYEVLVQYSSDYGAPGYVDGMDEVLEFAHTKDNQGPPSAKDVELEIKRLKKKYPNAIIEASTLDAYAESLLVVKDALPVVEEEIGDTWIHGIGSDPWKVSRYRTLLKLRQRWFNEGKMTAKSEFYGEFMTNLLLIAEHTWGLDYKKYLADFKNWTKKDFEKARFRDITTLEDLTERNAQLKSVVETDIQEYCGGVFKGSYRKFEASHNEQRQYLDLACKKLPPNLKKQAYEAMSKLNPVLKETDGKSFGVGQRISTGGWVCAFSGNGSLKYLEKDGKVWIRDGFAGLFQYEIYDRLDCVKNYYGYNRNFYENGGWAEGDFSKPGLEFVKGLKHRCYDYGVIDIRKMENQICINLAADEEASEVFGAPRKAQILYSFGNEEIYCTLQWVEKDASKIPEALWFGFNFDVENPNRWFMNKIGSRISPLNVVKGGNRGQHCVESLEYQGADGIIRIENIHSPLVSVGGRNLYHDFDELPDLRRGFSFNLFNNKWGTNFSMWCEDSCRFDYVITIKKSVYNGV